MEFEITSAKCAKYYTNSKRLLKDYPQIAKEFKVRVADTGKDDSEVYIYEVYITINTLEDLVKLKNIVDCGIIFNGDEIIIYDDYIE